MPLKTKRIRGTRDITPAEIHKWRYVERAALETAGCYGFGEVRTPIIEKTELFIKGTGESTDIVTKEMYSFKMGREDISLRPEGTPNAVRAALENGLLGDALPLKLCYIQPNFRHENPQAGRYRQHTQFGVECFGAASPSADAEVIRLARDLLERLGIGDVTLHINSIGCPQCRPGYNAALTEYYETRSDKLCDICRERLVRNPLRLLDCKNDTCKAIAQNAPKTIEKLCGDCSGHFDGLKKRLDAVGINYITDPLIVRGLDYYTKTVFEFISDKIGSQATVCGGGRYDVLIEQMGGPPTPGLGFGMGLDRILMVMEENGADFPVPRTCDIYIGSMGEDEGIKALALSCHLRREGFIAHCDTMGRSVKAQMKYANKIGARFSCIIGSNELETGKLSVKDMQTGEAQAVPLDEKALAGFLYGK
ncbi:MAG: histidine--tRNA ligase [Oscillospiraceae bacterium]|nr:histidine--tRNA ligase [Oscillospiraceae bacterium]